jgi:hypothetical protein
MPELRPYDGQRGEAWMLRRWIVWGGIAVMLVVLDGCTKCGPIWDDWMQGPKSCKSDHL